MRLPTSDPLIISPFGTGFGRQGSNFLFSSSEATMSMADWSSGFIAVDWGTTNRRAYLLSPSGAVLADFEDDYGVTSVASGGFPNAVRAITQRLGERPMLLAGMIGSNRGWREVPYLRCPAGPGELAARLAWVEPGRIAIVPGLAIVSGQTGDVMRGEEVQLFGLVGMDSTAADATVCHPGTHNKWAHLNGGQVTHFQTTMTGEIFALLRKHSILSPLLQRPVTPDAAFLAGVEATFGGAQLTTELFSIRAGVLLSLLDERDAAARASGLVIGCDLLAGLALASGDEVIVLGRPSLTHLYAAALSHCERKPREVDGAEAFVAGMQAIKEAIA
jgi:2-dehydro-3-deoxygalactonokinase